MNKLFSSILTGVCTVATQLGEKNQPLRWDGKIDLYKLSQYMNLF